MLDNVFLIDSPLQYLNALEAKNQIGLCSEQCTIVIFGGASKKNLEQIKQIVNADDWKEILIYRNNQTKFLKYLYISKLNHLSKRLGSIDHIFIGEYRSDLMRHFIHISKHNKSFLLDDGNVSTIIHEDIISKRGHASNIPYYWQIINRLFRLKYNDILNINFFTIYNTSLVENDREIIVNEYTSLKEKFEAKSTTNEVFFLGNILPELGLLSEEYYLELIKRVKNHYLEQKIDLIYFPHRRESVKKLNKISNINQIKVKRINTPIEYYLISNACLPKEVASFFSSALDNCYHIFKESIDVTSFRIPLENLHEITRAKTKKIYMTYDKYGSKFKILEI